MVKITKDVILDALYHALKETDISPSKEEGKFLLDLVQSAKNLVGSFPNAVNFIDNVANFMEALQDKFLTRDSFFVAKYLRDEIVGKKSGTSDAYRTKRLVEISENITDGNKLIKEYTESLCQGLYTYFESEETGDVNLKIDMLVPFLCSEKYLPQMDTVKQILLQLFKDIETIKPPFVKQINADVSINDTSEIKLGENLKYTISIAEKNIAEKAFGLGDSTIYKIMFGCGGTIQVILNSSEIQWGASGINEKLLLKILLKSFRQTKELYSAYEQYLNTLVDKESGAESEEYAFGILESAWETQSKALLDNFVTNMEKAPIHQLFIIIPEEAIVKIIERIPILMAENRSTELPSSVSVGKLEVYNFIGNKISFRVNFSGNIYAE